MDLRFLSSSLVLAALAGGAIAGCGASPAAAPEASASGGPLAGALAVTVVDETSGARVAGAIVRARSIETGAVIAEASTDAEGHASLSASSLGGSVSVEVASPSTVQLVIGVRTDTLVVALPGAAPLGARVSGNVRNVPEGATSLAIGAAVDVSLLRTPSLERAHTVDCTPAEGGCTFELTGAIEPGALGAATIVDGTGAVSAFVIGRVGPAGGTLDTSVAAEDFAMTLPSASGLTGIVGVPGLAEDGALVLLSQPQVSPNLVRVPARSGELAAARYWVLVEARPIAGTGTADPNARSVLFARGVTSVAELPAWGSWLLAPTATIDVDTAVTFDAVPGADVHAVDWIDASGRVRASAWVIDDTLIGIDALRPSGLSSSEVARVRVRALDSTSPPTTAGFTASAIEQGVVRFSERTLSR